MIKLSTAKLISFVLLAATAACTGEASEASSRVASTASALDSNGTSGTESGTAGDKAATATEGTERGGSDNRPVINATREERMEKLRAASEAREKCIELAKNVVKPAPGEAPSPELVAYEECLSEVDKNYPIEELTALSPEEEELERARNAELSKELFQMKKQCLAIVEGLPEPQPGEEPSPQFLAFRESIAAIDLAYTARPGM